MITVRVAKVRAVVEYDNRRLVTDDPVSRNMLGPVLGWFTRGLDLPVLKWAKTVLGQLA